MKEIQLTQSRVALVDDEDFERLDAHKWYVDRGYAVRMSSRKDGERKMIWMHRAIVGIQSGQETDHIDGNGLNNQKSNLRFCTRSQNNMNQRPRGGASRFKGVWWHKQDKKWQAEIKVNYKKRYLGLFDNEIAAALAYNEAAKKYFGQFARLNILEDL